MSVSDDLDFFEYLSSCESRVSFPWCQYVDQLGANSNLCKNDIPRMSVSSSIDTAQLRGPRDGETRTVEGDASLSEVWDATARMFYRRKLLPEVEGVDSYSVDSGPPKTRGDQWSGISEINSLLWSTSEAEAAQGKSLATEWVLSQWAVPNDFSGESLISELRQAGVHAPFTFGDSGVEEERNVFDSVDSTVPSYPPAFDNADISGEKGEPIPFGARNGDMQYLVDVLKTAIGSKTSAEVCQYMLSVLNYPTYMIDRAYSLAQKEGKFRFGRERAHKGRFSGESTAVSRHRQPARPGYLAPQTQGSGRAAPVHVRYRGPRGPTVPRPTPQTYTPSAGKAWLASERSRLEKAHPGQMIAMNSSAEAISRGSFQGSRRALADALSGARMYAWNWENDRSFKHPSSGQLAVSVPGHKSLTVGGIDITSEEAWKSMEPTFRRNKPWFKQGLQYFRGELSARDAVRLQASLTSMTFSRHQGGAHSVNLGLNPQTAQALNGVELNVNHSVSLFPEILEFAQASGIPMPRIRLAVQTSTALIGVFFAPTISSAALQGIQYVAGVDFLWARFGATLSKLSEPGIQLQGWTSFGGFLWDSILASSAAMIVRSFFSDTWKMCVPSIEEMANGLRKGVVLETAKDVARAIVSFFGELVARLRACVAERSIQPLFGKTWDPVAWCDETRNVMIYYTLLTSPARTGKDSADAFKAAHAAGLPVWWNQALHLSMYIDGLRGLISRGDEILVGLEAQKKSSQMVRVVLENARRFHDTLQNDLVGSGMRVAPYAVFLHGVAGTWKSNMADTIAKVIAEDNGFDATSTGTYKWRTAVNFQDTLTHRQWHISMDDIDQSVAPPQSGVPTHFQTVVDVVNNTPLPVESAAVEMKGKIRANPLFVTYCSNYAHAQLKGMCHDPLPFHRRFPIRARVVPKPQYANAAGEMDLDRATEAFSHDLWDLEVQRFDTTNWSAESPFASLPYSAPTIMSFPAFCVLLKREFRTHMERQRNLLARSLASGTARCLVCGLPTDRDCGCVSRPIVEDLPSFVGPLRAGVRDSRPVEGEVQLQGWFLRRNLPREAYQFNPLTSNVRLETIEEEDGAYTPDIPAKCFYNCMRAKTTAYEVMAFGPRMIARKAYDEMRKKSVAELSKLGMKFCAVAGAGIAVVTIIVKLARRHEMSLQGDRESVPSWLGTPLAWMRPSINFSPSNPAAQSATFVYDEMVAAIRGSYVVVHGAFKALGVVVSNGVVCYPQHLCPVGTLGKIYYSGKEFALRPTELNSVLLATNEMLLVRVPELPAMKGCGHFFPMVSDVHATTFDEVRLVYPDRDPCVERNWMMSMPKGPIMSTNYRTLPGDCGVVYVGRIGKTWFARAIHYGLIEVGTALSTLGEPVTQVQMRAATARMGVIFQGAEHIGSLFTKEEAPKFSALPVKSELRTALARGAVMLPVGEMNPRPFGATPKSSVRPTITSEYFRDFEEEWCGERGYWRPPVFKGEMRNGVWWSPWQDTLLSARPTTGFSYEVALVAICDFVSGVQFLDRDGYREYSEHEAIVGLHSDFLNPINPKTSVGPPFNQKKFFHYAREGDVAGMSPDMALRADAIERVLADGEIPVFFARCVLKDEGVKPGKAARVFTVLSAVANIALRQRWRSMFLFMRKHPRFFESLVGVDMSGDGGDLIVSMLASVQPSLDKLDEEDVEKLDKNWSRDVWTHVSLACGFIAAILGLKADEIESVVLGLMHTHYELKGDVFEAPWNPSGQDGTVECNGICMSFSDRYVYYRARPELVSFLLPKCVEGRWLLRKGEFKGFDPELFPYRSDRALCTYGDDKLAATRTGVVFSPDPYKVMREELGLRATSAAKTEVPSPVTLAEASFLKRAFKYDDELNRYLCPISKKTIAKMLVIHADSTLSESDQACVGMSNALREAALHGEGFYTRVHDRCLLAAREKGLLGNPNFDAPSYGVRREEMRKRLFSAWVVPHQLESGTRDGNVSSTEHSPSEFGGNGAGAGQ